MLCQDDKGFDTVFNGGSSALSGSHRPFSGLVCGVSVCVGAVQGLLQVWGLSLVIS